MAEKIDGGSGSGLPNQKDDSEYPNYNPTEARKLLDGTLEQRIINYAEIKYGIGKEVAKELREGNYREAGKDPFEVLDKICGHDEGEYWGDETQKSIDDTVKPGMLKVAAKGTLNLVNKTRWYYPLVGALPAKYQEMIAKKLGDDPKYYVISNAVVEGTAVTASLAYYFSAAIHPLITTFASGSFYAISAFFRIDFGLRFSKQELGKEEYFGSPILLPFFIPLYLFKVGKVLTNAIKESYQSAFQEEQQKLLPAPKKKKRKKKRIEEQPEIVLTSDGERFENPEEIKNRLGKPIVNWPLVLRDSQKEDK